MNRRLPAYRRSVTAGYLAAGTIAASLWLGVGVLLLPVMLGLALLHRLAESTIDAVAASHHRWLAAHHLWSVLVLLIVLVAPLAALPPLWQTVTTVLNTLLQAPHPVETLAAAWPALNVPVLALAGVILIPSWFVVIFWISWRLLQHGLRWADGRAAV